MVDRELTWLHQILQDFDYPPSSTLVICYNQTAIYIATNPSFHERIKHLEIDLHFVWEKVVAGVIKLSHICDVHQIANVMTKAFPKKQFQHLISKMRIVNPYLLF